MVLTVFRKNVLKHAENLLLAKSTDPGQPARIEQVCLKMAELSLNRLKTLWEKEKLIVTRNFSFSISVFERIVLQTRKTRACSGKG